MHIKLDNNLTRKSNSFLILKEIMKGEISRTNLASKFSLTMGGLTPIIKKMLLSELIKESKDLTHSTLGRKPSLLKINNDKFKIITISIDRIKYTISIVDFGNTIIEKKETHYQDNIFTKESLITSIIEDINNLRNKHKVFGISVTSPGPLNYEKGIILNPPNFNGWFNINIKNALSYNLLPFSLENDIDAVSYAESYKGKAQNSDKFMSLSIDQGVGCGIFINNKNLRKINRESCEIGHMSVNIFGEKCVCGNTGCLENYININSIMNKVRKSKNIYVNWIEVCNLYQSKDPVVLDIINQSIDILGNALVSLLNILDIELIILNGSFSSLGDFIPLKLEKIINSNIIFKNKKIKVVNSKLKDPETIGSSILFFEDFLWKNNLYLV